MTEFVPAPFGLDDVLEPRWLSAALSRRNPGIRVADVQVVETVSRISTNVRFRVDYAGSAAERLPRDLCVKGYFTEAGRAYGLLAHPEVGFYSELRDKSNLRTLDCLYSAYDHSVGHGVFITEDVVEQGAVFLDALSPYTVDQVAESLEQYAALHASAWENSGLLSSDWLAPRQSLYLTTRTAKDIAENFDGPIGAGVPGELKDPHRLRQAYGALAEIVESAEFQTVVHGDAHVGNVFIDAAGKPSLVDWQLVQRGPWYLDVGYHIASSLSVEERHTSEDDLLKHYLQALHSLGGPELPFKSSRPLLGRGILSGFYLWAITLKVDPAITTTLLERLGTAALDHQALQSVPRL